MPIIKRESIERIKEVADLYDIVSKYVQLKKSGANWKGLSPFTTEKTPSFYVVPDKKFFKCFSTGYAGDVFRFLELKENFTFVEAVEWLARLYNISLEYENSGSNEKSFSKNELLDIHETALLYFKEQFWSNYSVQSYWQTERSFDLNLAKNYDIGYAPERDTGLLKALKNYSQEGIRESGLFLFNQNDSTRLRARFEGRLMIPIRDVQDKVIGFSGRIVKKNDSSAKYINSPETPIFHKGNVLFGLNHARKFVKDAFYLVEGPLDVMRCWNCGLEAAVAPQGTGITETQMHLLRRYASKLFCLTDGDSAGQKCALRVIELSFKAGIETEIVIFPSRDDPDSFFLREGISGFDHLKRFSMVAFLREYLLPQGVKSSPVEKESFLKKFYEMLKNCDSRVTQEMYLEQMSELLTLDWYAIKNDFRKFCGELELVRPGKSEKNVSTNVLNAVPSKLRTAERDLLSLVLFHESIGEKINAIWDDNWELSDDFYGPLLMKVLAEIKEGLWIGVQADNDAFSEQEINEMFSILAMDEDPEDPVSAANFCLKKIVQNFAKKRLSEISAEELDRINLKNKSNLIDTDKFFITSQREKLYLRKLLVDGPKIS